jgi:hypothetical protein
MRLKVVIGTLIPRVKQFPATIRIHTVGSLTGQGCYRSSALLFPKYLKWRHLSDLVARRIKLVLP